MTELQSDTPLRFPELWERTLAHETVSSAQFAKGVTIADAVRYLQEEITLLNADSARLYTNYNHLFNDRTRAKHGQSEGASLELSLGNVRAFMACDKWRTLPQNQDALHLALRHARLFEEWGIATASYVLSRFDRRKSPRGKGSEHAESGDRETPQWMVLLGLGDTATLDDANAVYRNRAKKVAHDEDALVQLNHAIEQARASLRP